MNYTALFTELVRAEIELWDALDARLEAAANVSLAQFQALTAIAKFEAARVQDVSQELVITVGATSKLVDRLERDGHAVRQSNPTDRRSSIIRLTDSGSAALAAASATVESQLRSLFASTVPASRAASLVSELSGLRAAVRTGFAS